jgi:hypothetical protein
MENQRRHDMILQEGRYYRARSGQIYGPIQTLEDDEHPFYDPRLGERWQANGRSYSDFVKSSNDLVEELALGLVGRDVPSDATPKVDRVVLASKILPRLVPDLAPSMAARQALQYADAFL